MAAMGNRESEERVTPKNGTVETHGFECRPQWEGADGSSLLAMGLSRPGSPRRVFAYGVSGVAESLSVLHRTVERPLRHAGLQRSRGYQGEPVALSGSRLRSWGPGELNWPTPENDVGACPVETSTAGIPPGEVASSATTSFSQLDGPAPLRISGPGPGDSAFSSEVAASLAHPRQPQQQGQLVQVSLPAEKGGNPQRPLGPPPSPGARRPPLGVGGGYPSPSVVQRSKPRPAMGSEVGCATIGSPGEVGLGCSRRSQQAQGPLASSGRSLRPYTGLGTPGEPTAVGALIESQVVPRPGTAPARAPSEEELRGGRALEVVAEIILRGVFHADLVDGCSSSDGAALSGTGGITIEERHGQAAPCRREDGEAGSATAGDAVEMVDEPEPGDVFKARVPVVDAASIPISALEELLGAQLEALLAHLLDMEQQRARSPGSGEDSVRRISRFSPTLGSSRGPSPLPLRGASPPSRSAPWPPVSVAGGVETAVGTSPTPPSSAQGGEAGVAAAIGTGPGQFSRVPPMAHCRLLVQRCGDSKATVELSLDKQAIRARSEVRADEAVELLRVYFQRHEKLRLASEKAQVSVTLEPYQLVQRCAKGEGRDDSGGDSSVEAVPEYLRVLPEPPHGTLEKSMLGPGRGQMLWLDDSRSPEPSARGTGWSRSPEHSLWCDGSLDAEEGKCLPSGAYGSSLQNSAWGSQDADGRPGSSRGATAAQLIHDVRERTGHAGRGPCLRAEQYVHAYVMHEPQGSGPSRRGQRGHTTSRTRIMRRAPLSQTLYKLWNTASHMETFSAFSRRKSTRYGWQVMNELLDGKKGHTARVGAGGLSPMRAVSPPKTVVLS